MSAYSEEQTPPMRIMAALSEVCRSLEASQQALSARIDTLPLGNVDDILLRAARKALLEAAPEARRVQRWQRWSSVAGAAVVGLCAALMLGVFVWDRVETPRCVQPPVWQPSGGAVCWVQMPVAGK